jgi:hypothetical protein
MSILLVTSSGGVLLDLLALRPWWERHEPRWVAVPAPDTEEALAGQEVRWCAEVGTARPVALAGATLDARRHLLRTRPDVVVSAGTGLAVPWFVASRSLGVRRTWVETLNLVGEPGRAARICQRLANRVLVQRPELIGSRRRAAFVGELY